MSPLVSYDIRMFSGLNDTIHGVPKTKLVSSLQQSMSGSALPTAVYIYTLPPPDSMHIDSASCVRSLNPLSFDDFLLDLLPHISWHMYKVCCVIRLTHLAGYIQLTS